MSVSLWPIGYNVLNWNIDPWDKGKFRCYFSSRPVPAARAWARNSCFGLVGCAARKDRMRAFPRRVPGRSPRATSGERVGEEPERGVHNSNGLLSSILFTLWEEWEKKLASGSPKLRFTPTLRLDLKAIWNEQPLK